MKKIAIWGSTGSIGTQAVDVIRKNPDKYCLVAVSCVNNIQKLEEQIKEFAPQLAIVQKREDASYLKSKYPKLDVECGDRALLQTLDTDADIFLNSLVGINGLEVSYSAVLRGKTLALANKESLVTGGELIYRSLEKTNAKILPVDSEHSAIFQALCGNEKKNIKNIYLTASGGPFRNFTLEELENVRLEDALAHPNWSMGKKITIDSATLVNKALEVIEAYWLFGVDESRIKVLVHPQSIVHSMVEYVDNSVMAQLGTPDMRLPISYAFSYPDRISSDEEALDFLTKGKHLDFFEPDLKVFKTLGFAYEALRIGGSYSVCLNGANEALVDLFLKRKIKFLDIQNTLDEILSNHKSRKLLHIQDIFEVDAQARRSVYEVLKRKE